MSDQMGARKIVTTDRNGLDGGALPIPMRAGRPPEDEGPPRRRRSLVLGIGAALALLGVWGVYAATRPGAQAESTAVAAAGNDAPKLDGELIRFSDKFAQRSGIKGEAVAVATLAPLVTVSGTVTFDARKFSAVGARIDGRVRRVFKFQGDTVKPGDALAELESAELGRAEAQVMAARAKEKAAEADMKRERRLADARVTPEREAEIAKATFEAAHAERIAAERAVQALGGDLVDEVGVLVLRSPIAGRIVTTKIARGMTVDPTVTLFEVADLGSLWVELRVFERDLHGVRAGDKVEINAPAGHDKLSGQVAHVGDVIDLDTRTAPVRVIVDNAHGALRPGQSVTARIHLATPAAQAISVPRRAVTRIDGKMTVFVLHDKNTVEPRAIKTGSEDATRVAVLEGLKEGERIVVDGMFALKSEIFR